MLKPFHELDLGLLRILHSLVETGSTHESANRLGMSQSSISRSLKKLREAFGQQLFVRSPHGLDPSPLACELAEAVELLLNSVDTIVSQQLPFEPAEFQGELRLVVHRSWLAGFGAQFAVQLAKAMPKTNFSIIGWGADAAEKLLSGEYHYGLTHDQVVLPKRLHAPLLFKDSVVMVAREHHPGLSVTKSLRDLLQEYPIVRMALPPFTTLDYSDVEQWLKIRGISHRTLLKTDDYQTLLEMVMQQDAVLFGSSLLLATTPNQLAAYPWAQELGPQPEFGFVSVYPATLREQPLYEYLDRELRDFLLKCSTSG